MIETYYVFAKSKKELNERLENKKTVYVDSYKLGEYKAVDITQLNNGDVLKLYTKKVHGSPYATAYGNWDAKKGRVK